jgi:hypothetical protein
MAHRFNHKLGIVGPKPSASERTKYRWRMRKGIGTTQDVQRKTLYEKIKQEVQESIIAKLRAKKEKQEQKDKSKLAGSRFN